MSTPITVLLADDHPLICIGIRTVLASAPCIALVSEVTDGHAAQRLCQELQPDVLLLDCSLPGSAAAETVTFVQTHCPATRILVLSDHSDSANVQPLLSAGVAGCVLKTEVPAMLIQAIRVVTQGGTGLARG